METAPEQEQQPLDPFPRIPQELKELTQFVNWEYRDDTKVPVNPKTGGNAMVNQANTWNTYEAAIERGMTYNLGVGLVLTERDPYTVIDLDKCYKRGKVVDERSAEIVGLFRGAYMELSPSLTGIHIIFKSEFPVNRRTPGIECYSNSRWITMTGRANPQAPAEIPDRTEALQELVRRYFPAETHTFYEPQPVPVEDREVWTRLFNSKNGATFQALFNGDVSVTYNDHSRGVIFLANMLAMMTDGDAARMKALLYQTGLVNEKWQEKRGSGTWLDLQIADAIQWSRGRKKG